jgi:hypothetical protein
MTRRTFLRVVAWGGPPIAIASLAAVKPAVSLSRRAPAWLVARVRSPEERLRAHFNYLRLDPAGIEEYFADYLRYGDGFSRHSPLPPEVYTRYLLSTDFFRNGADESRLVTYIGFYDPALTPCNNPFATFDESAQ